MFDALFSSDGLSLDRLRSPPNLQILPLKNPSPPQRNHLRRQRESFDPCGTFLHRGVDEGRSVEETETRVVVESDAIH